MKKLLHKFPTGSLFAVYALGVAALIIISILSSCSSRKKHLQTRDSIAKVQTKTVELTHNTFSGSQKEITLRKKTDSGIIHTTIKPKGVFTFSNGIFTGEAESIDISQNYTAKTEQNKLSDQSVTNTQTSLKSQENKSQTKVKEKELKKESKNQGNKVLAGGFIAFVVGIAIWRIWKTAVNPIRYLGS